MADWGEGAAELWSFIEYWKSENYMAKVITKLHPGEPNSRIYTASSNSSACVRQAFAYEDCAETADTSVRPLLLYYAFLNWIKALLHVTDLGYPSEAAVLQHGVSVRRTKRLSYQLPSEMVYIYKQGVLQSAAGQVGMRLPPRVLLGDVVGMLPPIQHLIAEFYPKFQHLYPIQPDENPTNTKAFREGSILVPRAIAANNGQTVEEWIGDLFHENTRRNTPLQSLERQETSNYHPSENDKRKFGNSFGPGENADGASFVQAVRHAPAGYLRLPRSIIHHPWVLKITPPLNHNINQLMSTTEDRNIDANFKLLLYNRAPLARWVSHFIVLYCLSALVRYNPLEWSDILRWHNEPDALIVDAYLRYAPVDMRFSLAQLFHDMVTAKQESEMTESES